MFNILLPFGSQTYNLTNKYSDKDYIMFVKDESEISLDPNIEFYTLERFLINLNNSSVKEVELYYLYQDMFKDNGVVYTINKQAYRKQLSATVSNSYVKAKKKIKDSEHYVGIKSYFHCIRLLTFAIYLSKHNKLDFKYLNTILKFYYDDIVIKNLDNKSEYLFEIIDATYRPYLNYLKTQFKLEYPL